MADNHGQNIHSCAMTALLWATCDNSERRAGFSALCLAFFHPPSTAYIPLAFPRPARGVGTEVPPVGAAAWCPLQPGTEPSHPTCPRQAHGSLHSTLLFSSQGRTCGYPSHCACHTVPMAPFPAALLSLGPLIEQVLAAVCSSSCRILHAKDSG